MKYLLNGKNVLVVAPQFFGYEADICDEIRRRGATVHFLLDRPFSSPLMKAVTRLRREWVIKAADRYYTDQVKSFDSAEYDYVFVVNGQTLSASILARWREAFTEAIFILYMWDSFGNRRWCLENLKYFDHAFTFDRSDSVNYAMHFRPLFFSSGFEHAPGASEFDISFVGTAHTDRYQVVSKIDRTLGDEVRKHWYLYLQAKWVYWTYKAINRSFSGAGISDFRFAPLSKGAVQKIFFSSKAVLDIEHPQQTGLTMRTLETLGARKKLITTNKAVREYDFFSENNICVIDRHAPAITPGFLQSDYIDVAADIYQRYRLEGWLDEILEVVGV